MTHPAPSRSPSAQKELRMQALSHEPRTFRELVEADLQRAARLIIKVVDEIDWQVRIATPNGDYHLAITMPDDARERSAMLRRLEAFMDWKRAAAFCLCVEAHEPDAVYAVGISRQERHSCLARIARHPKPWTAANFGTVEWLPDASIDPAIAGLLARTPRPMTPKQVAALDAWFGVSGRFPAVHLPTGAVRGL
jgi:hypothetical protein